MVQTYTKNLTFSDSPPKKLPSTSLECEDKLIFADEIKSFVYLCKKYIMYE